MIEDEPHASGSLSPPPSDALNDLHLNGTAEHDVPAATNGTKSHRGAETVEELREELELTRAEKDTLAGQYTNLVAKLNAMRTTVANKLQQDAEELDRREQLVQQLTAAHDDLSTTVETLKTELIASNDEATRLTQELDALRGRALDENAHETMARERELRELQGDLERCRIEAEEWERTAQQERALREEAREAAEAMRREAEIDRAARASTEADLTTEREKVANLQYVLEDFQTAKDRELRQAVEDYQMQLTSVTQSLAEYKHRAHTAELQLEETTTNTSRTSELEKEIKEKVQLISKLRHDSVIMNEHLTEALRRLRRNATDRDSAVDRRLVTNVMLSFLMTPRADGKRFEMLKLLADILSWNDAEREKAGLQRSAGGPGVSPSGQPTSSMFGRRASRSQPELEKTDETESFSRMWVEFLLTEANAAEDDGTIFSPTTPPAARASFANGGPSSPPPRNRSLAHLSASPSHPHPPLPPSISGGAGEEAPVRKSGSWIRLPSFGSAAALASDTSSVRSASPPPPVPPIPQHARGKGKGKEREMSE